MTKYLALHELSSQPREESTVHARLTGITPKTWLVNKSFRPIRLSDYRTDLTAVIWQGCELFHQIDLVDPLECPLVEVICTFFEINYMKFVKVSQLSILSCSTRGLANAVSLVPRLYVPACAKPALLQLIRMTDGLHNECLKEFVSEVFSQHMIIKNYVRVGASWNNHHCYPGGLLIHSVESAVIARSIAQTMKQSNFETEVSIVVSLLHDLGKVATHSVRKAVGDFMFDQNSSHEEMTLHIIEPILERLATFYPFEVKVLRHLFTRLAFAQNKWDPEVFIEDIVRRADGLSAANQMERSIYDWQRRFEISGSFHAVNDSHFDK